MDVLLLQALLDGEIQLLVDQIIDINNSMVVMLTRQLKYLQMLDILLNQIH
jgi:hypothetical protein